MEKPATGSKIGLWKAVQAAITFQNRAAVMPHRHQARRYSKGFSGPIGPMIPAEARRKPKNFENQEPTSPKVSCMGRIKLGSPYCPPTDSKPEKIGPRPEGPNNEMVKNKEQSGIKKVIFGSGKKCCASIEPPARGATPSLIQTRRFASSRDALAGFDWTAAAQISPAEDRECYSDGERGCN